MKYILITIALFFVFSVNVSAQGPVKSIPAFNFSRLDKIPFTNKDLVTGKMSFFVFFDAGCDHCQHAIQYINQHLPEFKKAAVYLITLDPPEKIAHFMGKYGNNLKNYKNVLILQDQRNEFLQKFRPRKYPSMFLFSAQQQLILYDDNEQNLPRFIQQINAPGK